MAVGDFRSFTVDLTNPSSLDEIVEAMIQQKIDPLEDTIIERDDTIRELKTEIETLKQRIEDIGYEQ